jgi:hypothetical protein
MGIWNRSMPSPAGQGPMNTTHMNLPDAATGYAVLTAYEDGRLSLDASGTTTPRQSERDARQDS